MYLRSASFNELRDWLLENGYAEEQSGWGHASADDLAEALLKKFDVLIQSNKSIGD